ncbi:hypothetical protein AB0F96_21820 [Streptomyces sp. NPDC023998]|uniref:hypothetical protein n=1 Tax=Streptomyces sp. NPDC023998 TaxID=3154597 RepID=UPI0034039D4A
MSTTPADRPLTRPAAIAAAAGLIGLSLFQLALALGAPLGHAAWGGTHAGPLPTELRIASGAAILIWASAAMIVLHRAGLGLVQTVVGSALFVVPASSGLPTPTQVDATV